MIRRSIDRHVRPETSSGAVRVTVLTFDPFKRKTLGQHADAAVAQVAAVAREEFPERPRIALENSSAERHGLFVRAWAYGSRS